MLEMRNLGSSGPEFTTVGFGSWAVGGNGWSFGWGSQDDADSVRAIVHAVERGVNWIDTASLYGLGHSEEVVGKALTAIPKSDRPLVFTKGGMSWQADRPMAPALHSAQPESLRRDCEASLRRLGLERIDLYQIHFPDDFGVPPEDSWGEMSRLADEGKVRSIGVSNYNVELIARCEKVRHVDSVQPQFSMIVREAASEVIPWAAAHGTGVIVYSPMASGILTDAFSRDRVAAMGSDDWRSKASGFIEPALTQNIALRDALRPIAARHGTSVPAVAVAWTLGWSGVTGAIVGARKPEQVDGWLPAGALTLTPLDLDEIAAAIASTGAGEGPTRPTM
jgi:aryl-alcohol dehydrogenase-like predicted oxidoreductase